MSNISLTNFQNGITSFGLLTMGVGGMLPYSGNYFFVNETTGGDGNDGSITAPFSTLTRALQSCVAGNNDVVFVTGTIHVSATVAWSKNNTHLIGLCSPIETNQRARISQTGSTPFTPLVNVTAQGCIFANIGAFHGFADASAQICWAEAGGRNFYSHCSFLGMGNATAAAQAGGRSLTVTGTTGENTFYGCQIGLDTVTRSAANATLEFSGGCPRNTFRGCTFPALTSDTGAVFVLTAASGAIDRWALFEDCAFINCVKSGGSAMTGGFKLAASAGGLFLLQRSTFVGATDVEATAATNQIYIDGGAPTANATTLAVNNVT